MKKICIVNFNIYSLFDSMNNAPMGGAELDMYNLALSLKKKYNVSVITGDWSQKEVERNDDVTIYRSFKLENNLIRKLFAPFVLFRQLYRTSADIYISSGAGPEVGLISIFCKIFNKTYIYRTAHSIDCDGTYKKNNGINGKLYEIGLLSASKIVTSVDAHKKLLLKNYKKKLYRNNILNISLGLFFPKITNTLNKKGLLWIARGVRWKRPDLLIEIAKSIPKEKFTMIMPFQLSDKEYFYKIKHEAESLKNITFIAGVSFEKTQKYFEGAKIFINTSDNEGFTFTLIQSGLAHTPVAYLNVNPDKVITNFNIGEFGNGNINELIKKIKLLLTSDKKWKNKSDAIYNYTVSNHDMFILSKQWINLIDSSL